MRRNAHLLVANVAQGMAEELYEHYARDNRFYALTRKQKGRTAFVARMRIELLEDARGMLAQMLARDDVPEEAKERIAEALIADENLRHGRHKRFLN